MCARPSNRTPLESECHVCGALSELSTVRVAVCLKQVPDDTGRLSLRDSGSGLRESDCTWMLSPFDRYAIEEALRIRATAGGECVALHVGPDHAPSVLAEALALGVDRAVHAWDASFARLDPLGTARILAATVRLAGPFDLILTGQRGVGEDHGQTPGLLAELLDWPQATLAVGVTIEDGSARVVREVEDGREEWRVTLPAVVSAQKGLNEPRQKSLKGVLEAKRRPVLRVGAAELGIAASDLRPQLRCERLVAAPKRAPVRMIAGDPDVQARELVRLLRAAGTLR
jgi:electron transfer flavoprotein beta subunit